jgi:NAD(P)H dehydrogenase (quinone)
MRALVVLADPDPASFTHRIAETVVTSLRSAGHSVVVHDLSAERFAAAMSTAEREAYHGPQPVLDPLVRTHVDDVLAADTLIFVYPTWWSTLPATLKGWLERVMVPGVGFVFDDRHRVRPGLGHIRRLVGISTYAASRRSMRLTNDNGRRTIGRALRMSTGWRTRVTWLASYAFESATPARREAFLADVAAAIGRL